MNFANTLMGSANGDGSLTTNFRASYGPDFSTFFVIFYNNYYKGKFVDRFGNTIDKPMLDKGVDNTTVSNFARILLEAVFDYVLTKVDGDQIYVDMLDQNGNPGKYFPSGDSLSPTAALVYKPDVNGNGPRLVKLELVVPLHAKGVTESETKVTLLLANEAADQSTVLAKGFLDTLKSIDVGIVVAGKFAIGDNDTVKSVATTAIQVLARRSTEALFNAVFEEVDGDNLPLAQLIMILGS